jgi:hypothetical protein
MHDFLTGRTFSGNYDIPPHGVLVLDEHRADKSQMVEGDDTVILTQKAE